MDSSQQRAPGLLRRWVSHSGARGHQPVERGLNVVHRESQCHSRARARLDRLHLVESKVDVSQLLAHMTRRSLKRSKLESILIEVGQFLHTFGEDDHRFQQGALLRILRFLHFACAPMLIRRVPVPPANCVYRLSLAR